MATAKTEVIDIPMYKHAESSRATLVSLDNNPAHATWSHKSRSVFVAYKGTPHHGELAIVIWYALQKGFISEEDYKTENFKLAIPRR